MRWLARRVAGRSPTPLLLLGLAVAGLARLVVAVVRRPWGLPLLLALAVVVYVWAEYGWLVAAVMVVSWVAGCGVALLLLGVVRPAVLRSWWRGRHYRRRWAEAMLGCELVRAGVEPTLMRCTTTAGVDRLEVHLAPGQLVAEWRDAAPRLCSAFEVRSVRVRRDGPRDVVLLVRWRELRLADPEIGDDAVVELEVAETVEAESSTFPRRPR